MYENNRDGTLRRILTNKAVIAVILFIVGLVVFNWFRTHSYLSISITDAQAGVTSVIIVNQDTGDSTEFETAENTIKRVVARASYEVRIQQDNASYVSFITTEPFLQTTGVKAALEQERSRTFVGNEPGPCMYYRDVLYTYECDGDAENLKLHVPASDRDPTYVLAASNTSSVVNLLLQLGDSSYALTQSFAGDDVSAQYALYPLTQSLSFANSITIAGPDANRTYSSLAHRDGFLLYDQGYRDLYYYKDAVSAPERIQLPAPKSETSRTPANVSVAGSSISALYNSQGEGEDRGNTDLSYASNELLKGSSELIVKDNDGVRHYQFDNLYNTVTLCGRNHACLLSGGVLQIYDISGEDAKLQQSIRSVQGVQYANNKVFIANDQGVLALDPASLSGSFAYTYGEYAYCGMSLAPEGLLLCLTNTEGGSSTLLIDLSLANADNIDKKVLQLRQLEQVETVSAYKSLLYVTPKRGELVYDPAIPGYRTDRAAIGRANAAIDKEIRQLSIDLNRYRVINPYQ